MGSVAGTALDCDIKYVNGYRDRHGKKRYYYRRKGFPRVALPGDPGSAEFLEAYALASKAVTPQMASPSKVGSVKALILEWCASAEYGQLAQSTRRENGYVLNTLIDQCGDKPVKLLERRHLLKRRDARKDKPGAANKEMRVWKGLLKFAVDRGYRSDNPAQGIKMLKLGRHRAWTDAEFDTYEARWPLGTFERVAYDIALYTSQRSADQLKIPWSKIAGKHIPLRQSKTGKTRTLPLHYRLLESLGAWRGKRPGELILCKPNGEPYSERYYRELTAGAIAAAGLPDDCVWHGLRKGTARVLAELEVNSMPITGHASEAMRREYEADASQAKLATAAIIKWEKASRRKERNAKVTNQKSRVTNRRG